MNLIDAHNNSKCRHKEGQQEKVRSIPSQKKDVRERKVKERKRDVLVAKEIDQGAEDRQQ